jgi:hypothetical protein
MAYAGAVDFRDHTKKSEFAKAVPIPWFNLYLLLAGSGQ